MNDIFFADLVREISRSNGAGNFVLDGAVPGHQSFANIVPAGRSFHYAISNKNKANEWEVGLGHLDIDGSLVRSSLSQDGKLTDFSDGEKWVILTVAADWFNDQNSAEVRDHSHIVSDIDGLNMLLDSKQAAGDYAAASHEHDVDEIVGLSERLPGTMDANGNYSFNGKLGVNMITPDSHLDIKQNSNSAYASFQFHIQETDLVTGRNSEFLRISNHVFAENVAGATYLVHQNTGSTLLANTRPTFGLGDINFATRASIEAGTTIKWQIKNRGDLQPYTDNSNDIGASNRRVRQIYSAIGSINTSDENAKCDIGAIPAEWLDAWGDVIWSRYKFIDGQRWHIGLVAQRIHTVFARRDIDAFAIGLLCRDEWEDQFSAASDEPNPEDQQILTQAAGERWGLRYDECFALEAAWQRRELDRLSKWIHRLEGQI